MPSTVGIIREEVSGSPARNTPERLERIKDMLVKGFGLCGGLERVVHPGDKVFVKPNLFSPQNPEMGTVTDPGVLGALVGLLREAGARRVYVGENPALVKARVAFEKTGAGEMITAEGGELSCLDEEIYIECLNQDAKILQSVHLPRTLLEADVFITVPKVKTHLMTLLTLGIKNSMGLLKDEDKRLRYHSESLHQKLVDLLYYRKPDFVIEDAIVAAEGQGPVCPEPVQMNLLAFSKDVVAADAVISAITGFLPEEITMTRLAGALGLGAGRLEEITIQGPPMAEVRRVFKRAIYSPVGFLPDVEVYAGGACVPCLGILRSASSSSGWRGRSTSPRTVRS